MKLIFVRHAHRHKPEPDEDNGLSEKGLEQVQKLVTRFEGGELPKAKIFLSSPKKRCVETIAPMAEAAGRTIKIERRLDEQNQSESSAEFQKRLGNLIEDLEKSQVDTYLCSHGDAIPEMVDLLTNTQVDLSKGQAVVVENHDGKWRLS